MEKSNCNSCTGVLYFSREMQKLNQKPLCLGKQSVLSNKTDKYASGEQTDSLVTKQLILGYSVWNSDLNDQGQIATRIQGTEFRLVGSNPMNSEAAPVRASQPARAQLQSPPAKTTSFAEKSALAIENASRDIDTVQLFRTSRDALNRVLGRQWDALVVFPSKAASSVEIIWHSLPKTFERMSRTITSVWSNYRK